MSRRDPALKTAGHSCGGICCHSPPFSRKRLRCLNPVQGIRPKYCTKSFCRFRCVRLSKQFLRYATENFNSKVILLRLLYRRITGDATQQKYKRILSDSFAQLPIGAIYDFAFSGWLTPNQDALKEFLNRILEISKKGNSNMRVFPDPVETKLECVYLLHISDMLADISMLKPLSEGRPHLQFLLDPKNFDYLQVDFSDYMWENFARREEYMKTFVAHKEVIIPKIQKRIETGEVTEAEKRILYGFLLRGDEVWKM